MAGWPIYVFIFLMPSPRLELWTLASYICLELNLSFINFSSKQLNKQHIQNISMIQTPLTTTNPPKCKKQNKLGQPHDIKKKNLQDINPWSIRYLSPTMSRYDSTIHKYFKISFNLYFSSYFILYNLTDIEPCILTNL